MDSIGPAPTGPLPVPSDLGDDDVESLVAGAGAPPAWFGVAELLDVVRSEAAVEPDDLWVRTHVAAAAAAARRATPVSDPTAGRRGRTLRVGAAAVVTTTLVTTAAAGLAAADTLPTPLQSVASQVASLAGVQVPDGYRRPGGSLDTPASTAPPPTPATTVDGSPSSPTTGGRGGAVDERSRPRWGRGDAGSGGRGTWPGFGADLREQWGRESNRGWGWPPWFGDGRRDGGEPGRRPMSGGPPDGRRPLPAVVPASFQQLLRARRFWLVPPATSPRQAELRRAVVPLSVHRPSWTHRALPGRHGWRLRG